MLVGSGQAAPAAAGLRALRVAVVACALVSLALSVWVFLDVNGFGFPDGHLTAYQRAAAWPLRCVAALHLVLACGGLFLSRTSVEKRRLRIGLAVLTVAVAVTAAAHLWAVPWVLIDHLGLENGWGG